MRTTSARRAWRTGQFLMHLSQPPVDDALHLYCPGGKDLPLEHLVTLALLPIHDWNEELLKGLAASGPIAQSNFSACVLAVDPFRRLRDMLQEIERNNFRWVTNFPSIEAVDGSTRATLDDLDFALQKELQFVEEAAALGLGVAAFATTTSSALMMIERGATALVVPASSQVDVAKLPARVQLVRLETRRQG